MRWNNREGPYRRKDITVGTEMIDKWKVITSYVAYDHSGNPGKDGRRKMNKEDALVAFENYRIRRSYNEKDES